MEAAAAALKGKFTAARGGHQKDYEALTIKKAQERVLQRRPASSSGKQQPATENLDKEIKSDDGAKRPALIADVQQIVDNALMARFPRREIQDRKCFECDKPGHTARACPSTAGSIKAVADSIGGVKYLLDLALVA